ncbi:MAG: sirohydrochlorin chelatase [Alkalicoccus sp.]|nr:MAG: sirohydrochlorin chelatase [Alkalicoccus sp.]
MQGVLYVGHGSRVEKARRQAQNFMESVQEQVDVPLQEICFLELAEPDISQGIEKLVSRGAASIAVIPVLLLSAGHYYQDIPEEVDKVRERFPEITFTYGRPLGVQERVIDLAAQRIEETGFPMEDDSEILLVGRGSRNGQTKRDMETIAEGLKERTGAAGISVCYLAACRPDFHEGLEAVGKNSRVFVVPYLWFTGILMQEMEKEISGRNASGGSFILCQYLGGHPAMEEALRDAVQEALQKDPAAGTLAAQAL